MTQLDFRYPASDVHEVIEGGMPNDILGDMTAGSAAIGASLTGHGDLRSDCRRACHRWGSKLLELGHVVR